VILSFGDKATEALYHGKETKETRRLGRDVARVTLRRLDMLNAASALQDLQSPPGNRLEALKGDWRGHHSIRVNDRWRIVFRWVGSDAHHVRLIDYH